MAMRKTKVKFPPSHEEFVNTTWLLLPFLAPIFSLTTIQATGAEIGFHQNINPLSIPYQAHFPSSK
jgi:hypothetical protein